jgi:ABC-type Na+ efflux pump permease subunit
MYTKRERTKKDTKTGRMFKVPTKSLLLIGGWVWVAAGLNITLIGFDAVAGKWALWMLGAMLLVFIFFLLMFLHIIGKHFKRIQGYAEPRTNLFKFFDAPAYLIMLFMMTLGISLRLSGRVPAAWIAFFYTGLGTALVLAGFKQLYNYFAKRR